MPCLENVHAGERAVFGERARVCVFGERAVLIFSSDWLAASFLHHATMQGTLPQCALLRVDDLHCFVVVPPKAVLLTAVFPPQPPVALS